MGTFLAQFHENVVHFASQPCWRFKASGVGWKTLTWEQVGRRVAALATWLRQRGLDVGDRVAIWSSTRYEWSLADLASLAAGGVVVPIYQTLPPTQALFIVQEPACRFLFVERLPELAVIELLHRECPALEQLIVFAEMDAAAIASPIPVTTLSTIIERGALSSGDQSVYEQCWRARGAADLASLVYTSGTTGTPKGVELTFENFTVEVAGLHDVFCFPPHSECLMFLPLAHIVARAMQFFQIASAHVASYAESLEKIGENLQETRPHFFAAVPRIYEKVQARILNTLAAAPAWKQRLFHWAMQVGEAAARAGARGGHLTLGLRCRLPLARLITRPVKARLGGNLIAAVSGGAPLAAEVARFFESLGILILEGYGLTETAAAVTLNHLDDYRFGTVGKPLPQVHVRMADDGEILVRGPTVFRGYFQRPEETAAVLEPDGWFHTGDIGEFSRDGFLRITDRKKDLLKTSAGKYVAPQPIENQLKTSPYISDALLYGDRRNFVTALVTLDRPAVEAYAQRIKIPYADWEALTGEPRIVALVQVTVDAVNRDRASFEQVKKFRILPRDFAIEHGELTPTLKIRRKVAYERYRDLFESMYATDASQGAAYVREANARL
ncbi:MAG: long-chain fatty acid--CoA ligase [Deltaproteobacteria bacterium]|nr:long-chain fatty acid--CoA ligase [Deltaproteobacteria bacterium]